MDFKRVSNASCDPFFDAALFNDTTLLAISTYGEIMFYSLLTGKMLLKWTEKEVSELLLNSIVLFTPDFFMVIGREADPNGYRSKAVVLRLNADEDNGDISQSTTLNVVSKCTAFGGIIRDLSALGHRFATLGPGHNVQIWAWESSTIRCKKMLPLSHNLVVSAVSLFEKYILCTNRMKNAVHVYNANTMDFIVTLKTPILTNRYLSTGCDDLFIAFCSGEKYVMVLDAKHEAILWKSRFPHNINEMDVSVAHGVELIFATEHDAISRCSLPSHLVESIHHDARRNSASAAVAPARADVPSGQGRAKRSKLEIRNGSVTAVASRHSNSSASSPVDAPGASDGDGAAAGISCKAPSELKTVELTATTIEKMDVMEIATLWAAYIVRYADSSPEKFSNCRDRLYHVMEENDLDGALIVDRSAISLADISKTVVDGLQNDGKPKMTVGIVGKVKQFLNSIS